MSKTPDEITRDLISFRNEILENQASYEKIHDIARRLTSYFITNRLTSEDMRILDDPAITEIMNAAADQWFSSMLNQEYLNKKALLCEEREDCGNGV